MLVKYLSVIGLLTATVVAVAGDPSVKNFPPLPQAVSSFGAAATDGWLYIYGGHKSKTHDYSTDAVTGTFHRVSLASPSTWETLPGGPPCQGLALVAHGGKLYRVGGMQCRNKPGDKADNHSLASCERFDPKIGKWEPLPDLPQGRSSHDAVLVGDQLIVVGGWNLTGTGKSGQWHDAALVLDLKKPVRWETIKQPFRRRALTATEHQGKVYVFAGMNDESKTVLTVDIFDPKTGSWTTAPDLPTPRRNGFSPASCSTGGSLYASPSDGRILMLRPDSKTWEDVGELKQSRIVHRMVPAGANRLVVLGGAAGGDNIGLTEVIVPNLKKE